MHVTPSPQLLQALSNVSQDGVAPGRTVARAQATSPGLDVAGGQNRGPGAASAPMPIPQAEDVKPPEPGTPVHRGMLVNIVV